MSVFNKKHGATEPRFFLYTVVSENDTKDLCSLRSVGDQRYALDQIFNVSSSGLNEKVAHIILDFHFNNYQFALQNSFSNEKVSTFLSIMDHIFDVSLRKHMGSESAFKYFKEIMLRHSIQRPPHSLSIFSLSDVKLITDFAISSFFRHYLMYEYAIEPRVELVLETDGFFSAELPQVLPINGAKQINPEEIPNLAEYFYVTKGPEDFKDEKVNTAGTNRYGTGQSRKSHDPKDDARIEEILKAELERVQAAMLEKVKKQDEEFDKKLEASKKKK